MKIGNEGRLANSVSSKDDIMKEELKISSINFVGLDFSEKKSSRTLPAGLVPVVDLPFPEGDIPEVELIVGDASKFGDGAAASKQIQDEDMDVYKPKVSTWGVFPRPSNISKTVSSLIKCVYLLEFLLYLIAYRECRFSRYDPILL